VVWSIRPWANTGSVRRRHTRPWFCRRRSPRSHGRCDHSRPHHISTLQIVPILVFLDYIGTLNLDCQFIACRREVNLFALYTGHFHFHLFEKTIVAKAVPKMQQIDIRCCQIRSYDQKTFQNSNLSACQIGRRSKRSFLTSQARSLRSCFANLFHVNNLK